MRGLISFAVAHRVTVLMATLAALVFGFVSKGRLPVSLLPDLSYPTLTVQTEYEDAAPSEVENLITRPLEEAVSVVPGLRKVSSVSQAGLSEITLEFGWDTDMDFAALDVREKMDQVFLPQDSRRPVLLRFDPALDPVVRLALSGPVNMIHLRHLGERVVKKELEALEGVAAAKVVGGLTEEVHVDIDESRLAALGIPISDVAAMVGTENVNAAGGRLRDRDAEYLVRTLNQFTGPADIGDIIVFRDENRVARLKDVAEVTRSHKEREIVSRRNGEAAVEVAIYKEGDANIVDVAGGVRERLAEVEQMLPDDVKLEVLSDQSVFIQSAVDEVYSNAKLGGILAILVLLLFLRDLGSTAIIAVAIPTSVVATFILMYRQGVSLNVMSLGGLALGVGMLVDNSIVVLESIVRHRRESEGDRARAVIDGTHEVAQAVTASTLTTLAVFLPILFVEGIAGQIFRDQALTVAYALLVSLVVALTLTPMLAALSGPRWWSRLSGRFQREGAAREPIGPIRRAYRPLLGFALNHRALVMVVVLGLFATSIVGARTLGSDLIPPLAQGEFRFDLQWPEGTPIERTDEMAARVEGAVGRVEGVKTVYTNVGLDARQSGSLRSKRENHAELNVRLADGLDRSREQSILATVRRQFLEFPQMTATLHRTSYFTYRTPVAVEIYGYDLDELQNVSDRVVASIEEIPGLKDVATTVELGNPEVQIRFDRDRLRSAGLQLGHASRALRTKILGSIATDYKERDRQVDVLVRSREGQQATFADLENMVVGHTATGAAVRVASVADLELARGPARIHRLSQSRAALVTANLAGRDLGSVSGEIEAALAQIPLPAGVVVQLGGQNEERQSSFRSLQFAIALAVFLVYLVMASQFESLLNPFLILFTVPMALIGVVGGLWLTGSAVSVVVLIGGIMLAGIVVNNGIVLVDLIGQLRRRGRSVREAILEAGEVRLRPILMTMLTTVLGLLPMALGLGDAGEIRAPLAITVIGGLLVSTLLTLIVIPVLYSFVHREA